MKMKILSWRRDVNTLMIDEVDKAYIAGLFDGEGSYSHKTGYREKEKTQG